jgi:hypothetical protein
VTAPAFNEPFDPYYDQYSISHLDFAVPDHFDIYVPDFLNEVDFQCLSVICPSPSKGAKLWTYRGKWLTIGVYRDEGRDTAQRSPSEDPYNFFEQNYVFRLLPSFTLVPWSLIQELFTASAPDVTPQRQEIYNVTTETSDLLPSEISKSTNYNLPISGKSIGDNLTLGRRFGQVYDESGTPLKIDYIANGQPISSKSYDLPSLSSHVGFNIPVTTQVSVFDFYGGDINDPLRGPYHRTDLITRDTTKHVPLNNILRAEQNGVPYYGKALFDVFGNRVIGIQENNATVIRENLLPLRLDRFNRPVKSPIKTTGRLKGF